MPLGNKLNWEFALINAINEKYELPGWRLGNDALGVVSVSQISPSVSLVVFSYGFSETRRCGARKRSPKFFSAKSSALFAPRRFDFVPWPITTARAQAESTK